LKLRPQWLAAEGALTFLDLQTNASEAALARVTELRRARPKDGAVAALEGNVMFVLRRYAEASEAFDRAVELQPDGAHAVNSYQARLAGKLPNPAAPLERWIEQHPDDMGNRLMLADAYTQMRERRKAIQQYEQVLSRQPQNVRALNNAAWLYYETKDARAVELARKAVAAAPNSVAVSDTLGWILVETGAIDQGLPILERAAAQAAAEPEIGYHYAVALIRAGQVDKGTEYLRRLVKEHASFPSRVEAERLARDARAGI
jgi:predicted Zn-dependent protease